MANIFPQTNGFRFGIALMTKRPPRIFYKTTIGEFYGAVLATETLGVPVCVHGLNDAADDEFAAFSAARGEEYVEIVFAVLTALELVEHTVAELLETLGATGN